MNSEDYSIQRGIETLEETTKRQEHRIRTLETKSTQIINLYFIFQALILLITSSSSSTSSLKCRHWWVPLSLSLLSAVLNLISVIKNSSKIVISWDEIDQNRADIGIMTFYRLTKMDIGQVLPGTPLDRVVVGRDEREIVRPRIGVVRRLKRRLIACLYIGLFIGFSVVVMYICHRLLCPV